MPHRHRTLNKKERLKSRKTISLLFSSGKPIQASPVKLLWVAGIREDVPLEAGFAVPKKNIKHAVDRNHMKRLMREAYRLNQDVLYTTVQNKGLHLSMVFLFQSRQIVDYPTIEKSIQTLLGRLNEQITQWQQA